MLQNLLFYYENESCSRPSGVVLLEGCYCDRLITAKGKEPDKQVSVYRFYYLCSIRSAYVAQLHTYYSQYELTSRHFLRTMIYNVFGN